MYWAIQSITDVSNNDINTTTMGSKQPTDK